MNQPHPQFASGNAAFAQALNQVVEYARRHGINPGGRPGWNETPDGWMPPLFRSGADSLFLTWNLQVTDAGAGKVKLLPGTIVKDVADVTVGLTIADISNEFTVSDGDYMWLKLEYSEGDEEFTATVETGSAWPGYPRGYEITGSESTADWASTSYLLYAFTSVSTATSEAIGNGLFYERLVGDHHLAVIGTNYQSGTDKPTTGFTFIPFHKVVP